MADNQNVVDELVVKLTLSTADYDKADKEVNKKVDKTEKEQQRIDSKRKNRELAQSRRWKDMTSAAKGFGSALTGLATTVASVLGVGSAAGIVGAVAALAGFETNLRRSAVSTGLSNRELQAWGSTARRLGADATAGAAAIAGLAREQKEFNLTGNAPTLAALQRIGVNANANTPIVDILSSAQKVYRAAGPAQKQQIESTLSASGVSPDLIVAMKSTTDAQTAYTTSLKEATEENVGALNAVTDALELVKNSSIKLAGTIAELLQPYIEQFSRWVREAADYTAEFAGRVKEAGGGIRGFLDVLNQDFPKTATALKTFGEAIDLAAYGIKLMADGFKEVFNWIDGVLNKFTGGKPGEQGPLSKAFGIVADAVQWAWKDGVATARQDGPAPVGHLIGDNGGVRLSTRAAARIAAGEGGTGKTAGTSLASNPGSNKIPTGANVTDAKSHEAYMTLIAHGIPPAEAAAITANWERESGLKTDAVNKTSGASGLFQYLGPRLKKFQAQYGVRPDQATASQQLDFMQNDKYERHVARLAGFGKGSTDAGQLAYDFSKVFEANGLPKEHVLRAARAKDILAREQGYARENAVAPGESISQGESVFHIGTVNVQANDAHEFGASVKRVSSPQNYNSAVR
jgi:hypothetical protein